MNTTPAPPWSKLAAATAKARNSPYYLHRSRFKKHRDPHHGGITPTRSPSRSPCLDPKQRLYKNYTSRYVPDSYEPETPITSFRSGLHIQNPPPAEVHALILT